MANVILSFSLEKSLSEKLAKKAKSIDSNRSQYIRRLIRADLAADPKPHADLLRRKVQALRRGES